MNMRDEPTELKLKKDIILFLDRNFSCIGGDEVYFNNILKHLKTEKYNISLYIPEGYNKRFIEQFQANYITYQYSYKAFHNFFRFLNPLIKFWNFHVCIKNRLKNMNGTILITSDYQPILTAFLANRGIKTIFVPGSLVTLDFFFDIPINGSIFYKLSRLMQGAVIAVIEFLAYHCATAIIVSTKFSKSNITKYLRVKKNKVHIMPLGINLQKFDSKYHAVQKPTGKNIILSVGRLVKSKNADMAIETLRHLPQNYIWIMLGDGPEKEHLYNKIRANKLEKRFLLLGQRKDVQKFYYLCDAFTHLSYHENFGLVLLEAMSCGKPPIVLDPNCKGVFTASKEIIEDGFNGFFVSKNPIDIATKINKVISSNNERISKNCISYVRAKYSFHDHLSALSDLIDKVS